MNLLRNKSSEPICWEHNFLSDDEIEKIKDYTKKLVEETAKINNQDLEKPKKEFTLDYHIKNTEQGVVPRKRSTKIKWIRLETDIEWLFKKLINQIRKVNEDNFDLQLKFVEDLQFSEYNEKDNGFYAIHNDCGRTGSLSNFVDIRKLSFTIQLTDESEYTGGELILHLEGGEKMVAPKKKGTIVFFESNISHEVTPVTKGVRHSLVSWVQGPNIR